MSNDQFDETPTGYHFFECIYGCLKVVLIKLSIMIAVFSLSPSPLPLLICLKKIRNRKDGIDLANGTLEG